MKMKDGVQKVWTDDPYYDFFDGGYIDPEDLLEDQDDIERVNEAKEIIEEFLQRVTRNADDEDEDE